MKPFAEEDRYVYDLKPGSIVIDAGAHIGDFADKISNRYFCWVIALEPLRCFFDKLKLRFKESHKIEVRDCALGRFFCDQTIYLKGDSTGFYAASETAEKVRIVTLDSVCTGVVDLLKLNIEGSEFIVLEDMIDRGYQYRYQNIQVQFHPVVADAERRYAAIREALLKTHHLTFDAPWCWENYRLNE